MGCCLWIILSSALIDLFYVLNELLQPSLRRFYFDSGLIFIERFVIQLSWLLSVALVIRKTKIKQP